MALPTLIHTPSGIPLHAEDIALILHMERNGTVSWSDEEVTFNSGFKSNVYFRARNDLSRNITLLEDIAKRLWQCLRELDQTHGPLKGLYGIPTAGAQLAQAIAHVTRDPTSKYGALVVFNTLRTELKKGHGKDNTWTAPPDLEEFSPVTIENVISTAKAYFTHLEHLEEDGYPTKEMHHVAFADWELGGVEEMKRRGYQNVHTVYKMRDVMYALVQRGRWPKERFDEMNRRVNTWRKEHGL